MSLAFYRKYRPQNFDALHGQNATKETLMQALKQRKLSHAYLFSGPRGTGKTSTARLIAKAIQCESRQESGQACGECLICKQIEKNELIDLIEIDAASNRGIDEIRDLREKIRFSPSYAKSKVYIIDEVHMLTKEAFNALLKSLEEPPKHVYFILATTEIHKIPDTIISRCQRYDFRRIAVKDIVNRLQYIVEKENLNADKIALELIAKYADGGMRDAITLLEQFSNEKIDESLVRERLGLAKHQACEELYIALIEDESKKALEIINVLHEEAYDLSAFTVSFLSFLREKLHEAINSKKKNEISRILELVTLFDKAWIKLKKTSISQLPLEIAIIRANSKYADSNHSSEDIKNKFEKALLSLDNAAVRQSFKAGKILNYENQTLTFKFSSKFHHDKVNNANTLLLLEEALSEILQEKVKVLCELDDENSEGESDVWGKLGWESIEESV